MQTPTNPWNHTELQNLHVWVWNLPRNLWNQIQETEKPVNPRNSWNHKTQGIRKVLMKSLSLDETYYYETCETYENHAAVVQAVLSPVWTAWNIEHQETFQITKSWNHETSKL